MVGGNLYYQDLNIIFKHCFAKKHIVYVTTVGIYKTRLGQLKGCTLEVANLDM